MPLRRCSCWGPVFTVALAVLLVLSGCSPRSKKPSSTELTILYNAEEQPAEKSSVAQILQAQLSGHGIPVKLEAVPNSIYYDRIGKGDYEATIALWYLDYDDPEGFLTDFYSKASFRMAKYSSAAYDKAYEEGLFAPDEGGKLRGFRQAEDIIAHDLPWIPLYSNDELFLLRREASGFGSNAYQYYDYRRVGLDSVHTSSDVEIQTFDPTQVYDLGSKHVASQCYEGLIAMDQKSKIVPALATTWTFSSDNRSLTFKLRERVMFQPSGAVHAHELTAADVKASFERMLKSNSPYAYIFDYVTGVSDFKAGKAQSIAGFEAVDLHTFRITMTRPFPTMLPWLLAPAAYIVPRDLPPNYQFAQGSVGTGPFVLKSFDGSVAQLVANRDYWGRDESGRKLPLPKSLSIRVIKDVNTEFSAFRRGELDILNVPVALYGDVLGPDGQLKPEWSSYSFREVSLNNLKFISFNMQRSPWGTDLALRRKVAASIDVNAIVQQLFKGKARVARSVIPSGIAGFSNASVEAK